MSNRAIFDKLFIAAVENALANSGKWMLGGDTLTDQKLQPGDIVSGINVNFCDLPERDCWLEFPGIVSFAIYKGAGHQWEKDHDS